MNFYALGLWTLLCISGDTILLHEKSHIALILIATLSYWKWGCNHCSMILILESIYNLTTISNIICVIVERFCLDANQNYFCKSNERWHAYAILLNDYFEYFKRSRILSEWLIIKHIYTSNTKYFSKLVSYDVLLTTHLYLENRSNYSCLYIVCFPFDVNGISKIK